MKEIERRFFVKTMPQNLHEYKSHNITQGYVFFDPVVRLRKTQKDFFLTIKTGGLLVREETEINITKEHFENMWQKVEGNIIDKTRYEIPLSPNLTAELDIFHAQFETLVIVEVEFDTPAHSQAFTPPDWFGEEITFSAKYTNKALAQYGSQSQ